MEADAAFARDEAIKLLKLSLKKNFSTMEDYERAREIELRGASTGKRETLSPETISSKVTEKILEIKAVAKESRGSANEGSPVARDDGRIRVAISKKRTQVDTSTGVKGQSVPDKSTG